jgi:fimbrial chaperone protein
MSAVHSGLEPFMATRRLFIGAVAVLGSLVTPFAQAGVFSVVPVRIYMTPRDRAVAITVTNEGDTDMVLQAEVNTWRQKPDGTDEQVASDDLILSPPILKLKPRARQVVRLARVAPPDLSQQLTYRLLMREVPEAAANKPGVQISVALALSMPVFVTPPGAKAAVACDAVRAPETGVQVSCTNTGNAYAQVREIKVQQGGQEVGKLEGGFYVLPGARKSISVRTPQSVQAGDSQLSVTFDDGSTQSYPVVFR